MKYIDAEQLKSVIKAQINERKNWMKDADKSDRQDQLWSDLNGEDMSIIQMIDSLQQDKETLDMCNQAWWEEQGWIMIPPNVSLSGIESLLNQIKRKRELGQDNENEIFKKEVLHIVDELHELSLSDCIPYFSKELGMVQEIKSAVMKLLKYSAEQKSTWKPSEEQMNWMESAVKLSTDKPHIHGIIISLYDQLKRL